MDKLQVTMDKLGTWTSYRLRWTSWGHGQVTGYDGQVGDMDKLQVTMD